MVGIENFDLVDADGDGFMSKDEFTQYRIRQTGMKPNSQDWDAFNAADKDGDGQISLQEFERFKKLQSEQPAGGSVPFAEAEVLPLVGSSGQMAEAEVLPLVGSSGQMAEVLPLVGSSGQMAGSRKVPPALPELQPPPAAVPVPAVSVVPDMPMWGDQEVDDVFERYDQSQGQNVLGEMDVRAIFVHELGYADDNNSDQMVDEMMQQHGQQREDDQGSYYVLDMNQWAAMCEYLQGQQSARDEQQQQQQGQGQDPSDEQRDSRIGLLASARSMHSQDNEAPRSLPRESVDADTYGGGGLSSWEVQDLQAEVDELWSKNLELEKQVKNGWLQLVILFVFFVLSLVAVVVLLVMYGEK